VHDPAADALLWASRDSDERGHRHRFLYTPVGRAPLTDGASWSPALRLSARSEQCTDNRTSHQELHLLRKTTGSVPTEAAVKELAPAWAKKRYNVFQIRRRARCCSEGRWI
jgi:hypothetical protein